MSARVWLPPVLALLLVCGGCDPQEHSDEDQWVLQIDLAQPLGTHSHRVLVGSTFGLEVYQAVDAELDDKSLACVARSGSGAVVDTVEGKFQVSTVGSGAVELASPNVACPNDADVADYGPDRWSVIGVEPGVVAGRWAHGSDAAILDYGFSPGPQGVFPDIIGQPLTEFRVVGTYPFVAEPALVDIEEREVRWGDPQAQLNVPAHYQDLIPTEDKPVDLQLEGTLNPGESVSTTLTVLGTTFALPPIKAVAVESIQSLELVPVYNPGNEQREWGTPAGVLAIVRDGEGRRIVNAPVDFHMSPGYLSFSSERDTLYLADVCRKEVKGPTQRTASIDATVANVDAKIDLSWTALPGDEHGGDPNCVKSCACTTEEPRESILGVLALVGGGVWLRRRKRTG